jgi:hypothetical protein
MAVEGDLVQGPGTVKIVGNAVELGVTTGLSRMEKFHSSLV